MNAEAIAQNLANRKQGQFFSITVKRPAKTRKSMQCPDIQKQSTYQGILCDYASRKPVREAVEQGEREAPKLPTHIADVFHIQGVKFWRGKDGQVYFPMPISGNKPKVKWLANGTEVPYDEVKSYLLACETYKKPEKSAIEDNNQAQFNAIKVENILEIK